MSGAIDGHIAERLAAVRARIEGACSRAGRSASSVRLIAVSKTRSAAEVEAARTVGQLEFGENRVQEAVVKFAKPSPGLRLHLVGHLQRNKVRAAVDTFDVIHSVDDLELLSRIEQLARAPVELLVQVKLADESTKRGASRAVARALVVAASTLARVRVVGLMTLPPPAENPEDARVWFRELRELRDELGGASVLPHLSMGMSHDFEVAIEEGATLVRVGEAIFGPREPV